MVDKVKNGEPLFGTSKVSSYLQGVAARNSRYSQLFIHVIPWFNGVNHDQVSNYRACVFILSCMDLGLTTGISMVSTLRNITNKPKGNLRLSVCRRPDPAKHYDAPEYENAESSGNKGLSVYS